MWFGRSQSVFWLDIPTGRLRGLTPATGQLVVWDLGPGSAGLAVSLDGTGLLAGLGADIRHVDPSTGTTSHVATLPDADPEERINDLRHDPDGNLWVATMHLRGARGIGRLLRHARDHTWSTVLEGLPIVNGPAFDAARRIGFVCDTIGRRVQRFELGAGASDAPPRMSTMLTLAGADGSPDGITVDDDGNLWLAHHDGAQVTRRGPDGAATLVLSLPVQHPTSVAIGAGRLFITTAAGGTGRRLAGRAALYAFDLAAADARRPP